MKEHALETLLPREMEVLSSRRVEQQASLADSTFHPYGEVSRRVAVPKLSVRTRSEAGKTLTQARRNCLSKSEALDKGPQVPYGFIDTAGGIPAAASARMSATVGAARL
jgi:hypothetical protein